MRFLKFTQLSVIICLFCSCQDVIDIKIDKGEPVMVVEGWLTNKREVQYIKLYKSKGITEAGEYPPVSQAQLVLSDGAGHKETLTEVSQGSYAIAKLKAVAGRTYTLSIQTSDGSYEAVSTVPRLSLSPDSVTYKYEDKSIFYEHAGYYPMINGAELDGPGDYVQIKLYKNGRYLNSANDLNLFSDKYADGYYIMNMELNVDSPYVSGDLIKAEVWSLTEHAYFFWHDIRDQLFNAQVFATPLTNVRSNIDKVTPGSKNVTGYFGTSIVRSAEKRIK